MVHGIAGFQVGCRCQACREAESARTARIGLRESERWEPVNTRADRVWKQQQALPLFHRWTRWTDEDIAFALDHSQPVRKIANALGRSTGSVAAIRRKYRSRDQNLESA